MPTPRPHLLGPALATLALTILLSPTPADAFCGFYVSQASDGLHADTTAVTLMRKDRATVMAMENNYRGPPDDFAMVVPVPEILEKKQVKTIDDAVFDRVKKQTAPRLVEYWEQDPCPERSKSRFYDFGGNDVSGNLTKPSLDGAGSAKHQKVRVKARFQAGEYDVVILSSEESNALETWLHDHDYKIPKAARTYFRPYIQRGDYFFVAKVDVDRLTFEDGSAQLSPLRFHYESADFRLPIRLGLINSAGTQDLLAFTITQAQRYEVANRPNALIPTNLVVDQTVQSNFPTFYDRLFSRTTDQYEDAVITEYAWRAGRCDPCPSKPMSRSDFRTLGGDVIHDIGNPSTSPDLKPENVELSSDALDSDAVRHQLAQFRRYAHRCVHRAAKSRDIRHGNLVLEFQIGPAGRVRAVSIEEDDFGAAGQCLGAHLFNYSFAPALEMSTRSVVTVRKTYKFENVLRRHHRARGPDGWTLTRLHYRYDKSGGGRDLVFQKAPPLYGGRGTPDGLPGQNFSVPGTRRKNVSRNQYQARYMILHEWNDDLDCSSPDRGDWGHRNDGSLQTGSGRPTDQSLDSSLDDLVTEGTLP